MSANWNCRSPGKVRSRIETFAVEELLELRVIASSMRLYIMRSSSTTYLPIYTGVTTYLAALLPNLSMRKLGQALNSTMSLL
jgi:hypothetical protein